MLGFGDQVTGECKLQVVFYRGARFLIFPGVYSPAEDTFLLADRLEVHAGEKVLELGTGCGLLAVLAAKEGGIVTATDVSPTALRCARLNASINGVSDRIFFRLGTLFRPVDNEEFDLVIFNPPYLPTTVEEALDDQLDRAWNGGRDGRAVLDPFIRELSRHLPLSGRALFVQSSLSGVRKTCRMLEEEGLKYRIISSLKFPFEELLLFLVRKSSF